MSNVIYNSLKSSDLDVAALSTPGRIGDVTARRLHSPGSEKVDLLVKSVADQINRQRSSFNPPFEAIDLEDMIANVIVETSAQGSSLLEIDIIDPYWILLRRDPRTGWAFIDVDTNNDGYLWPPIEINFPEDVTDSTWRLCQAKPTTDLTGANLTLVFEDKIVAEMREHDASGPSPTDRSLGSSHSNETRAEFIERCVKTVNKNQQLSTDVDIRFVPLLDPSDFTSADLIGTEITPPASATQPNAPSHRQNFTKSPGLSGPAQIPGIGQALGGVAQAIAGSIPGIGQALGATTILSIAGGAIDGVSIDQLLGGDGPLPVLQQSPPTNLPSK